MYPENPARATVRGVGWTAVFWFRWLEPDTYSDARRDEEFPEAEQKDGLRTKLVESVHRNPVSALETGFLDWRTGPCLNSWGDSCQNPVHHACLITPPRAEGVAACPACGVVRQLVVEPVKEVKPKPTSQEAFRNRQRQMVWFLVPFLVIYGMVRIGIGINTGGARGIGDAGVGLILVLSAMLVAFVLWRFPSGPRF